MGEDVENILLRLIQAADWDVARAEHGVIYIDELDKIARKGRGQPFHHKRRVRRGCSAGTAENPRGVRSQRATPGRPQTSPPGISPDQTPAIFYLSAAGLSTAWRKSWLAGRHPANPRLGFLAGNRNGEEPEDNYLTQVDTGRLAGVRVYSRKWSAVCPLAVTLEPLDKDSLVRVLTEPKNAIVKQYQQLFSIDGVEPWSSRQSALEAAAERALEHQTGARCLRYVIEETLLDVMYDLPSLPERGALSWSTADAIEGTGRPHSTNPRRTDDSIFLWAGCPSQPKTPADPSKPRLLACSHHEPPAVYATAFRCFLMLIPS